MEFDLDKIKQEIEARKTETVIREQATGKAGIQKLSKREFLTGLLTSVNQSVETPAVQALKTLTETTEQRYGAVGKPGVNASQTYVPPTNQVQPINEIYTSHPQSFERGDAFFEKQMAKAAEMLKLKSNSNQQPANAGLSQTLAQYANAPFMGAPANQSLNESLGGGINASMLNEHINRTMTEVMGGSNFTKLVEGAYKNMINEMYTREKVESVLVEIVQGDTFKKILTKQIVETLKFIQNRIKEPTK